MLSSLKELLVDLCECYVKLYGGVGVKSNDGVSSYGSGVSETFYEKEKFSEDSLWGQKQQAEDVSMGISEVELYLLEACEKLNDKFDILACWKNCSIKFPILLIIAKDIFSMPISTVTSESAFSTERRILDPFRSSLTPKLVEGLVLIGNLLSASCPIAEPCVAEERSSRGYGSKNKNEKEARDKTCMDMDIDIFFFTNGIAFNVASSPSFINMCRSIGNYDRGLKPPTTHELSTTILKVEEDNTKEIVSNVAKTWSQTGVTIMSDG
ncbi:hypothetical protein LWI29_024096 [Acer saccharum]|uniref:HAT C-terminal dimerisation domain-containing protein n=1 Tax=Acer saccharum TaxID=4024 RepID=A0AA39VN46_ACESA|nr:hypothetical protein LWI29_024096 [Acer saccharum]